MRNLEQSALDINAQAHFNRSSKRVGQMLGIDQRMAQAERAKPDHTDLEALDYLGDSGIRQPRKSSMKAQSAPTTASKKAEPASGLARRGSPSVPFDERSAKS